ncbi:hypothetical protein I7I48_08670 [Histoplasma ohiense]|nr:hypothetical protein I7I48_08670 [Histoplasma ohiense (nom. inval.)]
MLAVGIPSSLLPLPKPLMTGPESLMGYGGAGPESGPATGSRGPPGRILSSPAIWLFESLLRNWGKEYTCRCLLLRY